MPSNNSETATSRGLLLPSWLWAGLAVISHTAFLASLNVYSPEFAVQVVAMVASVITVAGWALSRGESHAAQ